jgi:hypothetical protein
VCDTDEMMVIEVGMLGKKGYCWDIESYDFQKYRSLVGVCNELALSLCVKSLARWIIEGLCNSERMPEPRRVSAARKRQLKNATVG